MTGRTLNPQAARYPYHPPGWPVHHSEVFSACQIPDAELVEHDFSQELVDIEPSWYDTPESLDLRPAGLNLDPGDYNHESYLEERQI